MILTHFIDNFLLILQENMLREETSTDSQDNFAKALLKDIVAAGGRHDWIQIHNNR